MSFAVNGTTGITFNDNTNMGTAASLGPRNRIINGNMAVWQRGTSFSGLGYSVDRWQGYTGTITSISQSTDVPSGYKYSASLSGSNFFAFTQSIESLNSYDLVGQNVTISFWLKQTTGAGSGSIAIGLYYPTAIDNWSSKTQINSFQYITPTSSWVQYSLIFTNMPSGVANGLMCYISSNASGTAAFQITGVQLEVGSVATPYQFNTYSDQLAQCQRYFYVTTSNYSYQAYTVGGQNAYYYVFFPVQMRAAPTISSTMSNISCSASPSSTTQSIAVSVSISSTTTFFSSYSSGNTASAEL